MDALKRRIGLSLAETVVASFLLLAGFLVVARLFHTSIYYQGWVDAVTLSTGVGEEMLESVRAWAQSPTNFDNLEAIYAPQTFERDGMQVTILAGAAVPMATPCNEMEQAYPADQQRVLRSSYKRVQVTVKSRRDTMQLYTLLGAPPRSLRSPNPMVAVTNTSNLAQGASASLACAVYDDTGAEIPDIFFSWSVEPISGRGELTNVRRDGAAGNFTHQMMLPDGTMSYSPGLGPATPSQCQLGAGAMYCGRELTVLSPAVDLEP